MAFSTGSSGVQPEINVTPMIDVLLVLIIIFMVIQPTYPMGLTSSVPTPKKGAASSTQRVVVRISAVDASGAPRYRIGQTEASFADLRPRLQAAFANRETPDRTLFVEADRELSYQRVAEVAGVGRAAGAASIALARAQ